MSGSTLRTFHVSRAFALSPMRHYPLGGTKSNVTTKSQDGPQQSEVGRDAMDIRRGPTAIGSLVATRVSISLI